MSQDFFEFIIQNPNIFAGKNQLHNTIWRLSTNPQLTFDQLRLISEAWNFPMSKYFPDICKNPNLNWEIIENNINDYPWDFGTLSTNNNFDWDIISTNREFNWNFCDSFFRNWFAISNWFTR